MKILGGIRAFQVRQDDTKRKGDSSSCRLADRLNKPNFFNGTHLAAKNDSVAGGIALAICLVRTGNKREGGCKPGSR